MGITVCEACAALFSPKNKCLTQLDFLCVPISDSTALVSLLFALKKARAAGRNVGIHCLIEVGTRESVLNMIFLDTSSN